MLKNLKGKIRSEVPVASWRQQVINFVGLACVLATVFIIAKFGFPAGMIFILIGLAVSIVLGKRGI